MDSQPTQQQVEEAFKEAASILICNWSDLNMAIEQGLSQKNKKFNLEGEEEIEILKQLVGSMQGERNNDIMKRLELINYMVDLCIAEDIEQYDFEDCLMEFMEINFNVFLDDQSAKEIAEILMTVRKQIGESLQNNKIESQELQKLREFNEKQKLKQQQKQNQKQEEMQVDTEHKHEEKKSNEPVIDDDGFQVVTKQKGRK